MFPLKGTCPLNMELGSSYITTGPYLRWSLPPKYIVICLSLSHFMPNIYILSINCRTLILLYFLDWEIIPSLFFLFKFYKTRTKNIIKRMWTLWSVASMDISSYYIKKHRKKYWYILIFYNKQMFLGLVNDKSLYMIKPSPYAIDL